MPGIGRSKTTLIRINWQERVKPTCRLPPERLETLLKPQHAELDVIRVQVEEAGYKGGRDRLKGLLDVLVEHGTVHTSTGPRGVRRWGSQPQPDDTMKGRINALKPPKLT